MSDRQLAGIAVGPDSLAVTLASRTLNETLFADLVSHKLQGHTPQDIDILQIGATITVALAWHHESTHDDAIANAPGTEI